MGEDVFVVDRECLGPVMQHLKSGEKNFHVKGMSLFFIYILLEEESNYFFGKSSTFSEKFEHFLFTKHDLLKSVIAEKMFDLVYFSRPDWSV